MMFLVWLVVAVIALIALGYAYWVFLLAEYNEPVNADEIHSVKTTDLWTIRLYRLRPKTNETGEPVLMVHGTGTNRMNFLTPEGLSLADYLSAQGYDCWAIDFRGERSSQPPFDQKRNQPSIDDYLQGDLPAAMAYIKETTGHEKVHWIGHSLGGMLLYAYEQYYGGEDIASGVTVAAPVGFAGCRHTSRPAWITLIRYARPLVSAVIRGLAPVYRLLEKGPIRPPVNWDNLRPECNGRLFFHAVEVPPYRVLEQMDAWAASQTWTMQDGTDLAAGLDTLQTPLLAFFANRDPFISVEAAEAFFEGLPGKDKALKILGTEYGCGADYGHIDPLFSPHSEEDVFAPTAEWLAAHSVNAAAKRKAVPKKKTAAKTKTAPKKKAAAKTKAAANSEAAPKEKAAPKKKAASITKSTPKKKAAAKTKAAPKKKATSRPASDAGATTESPAESEGQSPETQE